MDQIWPREPQGRELEGLTQLFKALGDPSRVKILGNTAQRKNVI